MQRIDVTGYTFSSIDDITELFNSYGVEPELGPARDRAHETDSVWAPAFFSEFVPSEDIRGPF